jgi:hypothetical protein
MTALGSAVPARGIPALQTAARMSDDRRPFVAEANARAGSRSHNDGGGSAS